MIKLGNRKNKTRLQSRSKNQKQMNKREKIGMCSSKANKED